MREVLKEVTSPSMTQGSLRLDLERPAINRLRKHIGAWATGVVVDKAWQVGAWAAASGLLNNVSMPQRVVFSNESTADTLGLRRSWIAEIRSMPLRSLVTKLQETALTGELDERSSAQSAC